jgi:hypothetical protein
LNSGFVVYDGGDGDDEIWAAASTNLMGGEPAKYYGGNGDDILKGPLDSRYGVLLAGQGG